MAIGSVRFLASAKRGAIYRAVECHYRDPILVIGRYDPRTKFANSVLASRRLGNAVLLTSMGTLATPTLAPASTRLSQKYLVTKTTPPVVTVCRANHATFDPDFDKPLSREQQPID